MTTIVSDIGSFREYGDAVVMVDAEITEQQLADVMLASYRSGPDWNAIKDYVEKNSVAAFQARMLSVFSEIEKAEREERLSSAAGLRMAV